MAEKKVTEMKNLKPGSYVLIDGEVYKVEKLQISKPGKHGGAKARITAAGVFSDKKVTVVKPADAKMDVPIIQKKGAQVISISGDVVQLMDLEDYSMFNAKKPDFDIQSGDEVVIWKFENNVIIKSKK